ncbi:Neuritin-like protein [Dissostichus eleginoides]|uniref:Neuritin-like protein n=1 Tax=Dissostichus eleginoides TaxID=100907 RepID=A0AAD9C057_DISEL|nr:Neuritin-like protein [Dissostichus eleginoides]
MLLFSEVALDCWTPRYFGELLIRGSGSEVDLSSTGLVEGKMKKSQRGTATMLLPIALCLSLVPVSFGAAIPVSCASIYKSFAQCLLTLGDSLVETQQDQNTQDIDAICRSWNAFHVCANSALAGCPGDAAAVWESLRQESRKTQFSGNLYDMCASRTTLPPSTVPAAPSPPTSDQTNKETLKGQTNRNSPPFSSLMFPVCSTLLLLLRS